MMTPQNQLYNLAHEIKHLSSLFEGNKDEYSEGEISIFDRVRDIHVKQDMIMKRQETLYDQLALIIKYLVRNDEKNI